MTVPTQEMSDLFKAAGADARKSSTPTEASCIEELLANGWTKIHASPFFRAPSGELYPSAFYSWQLMKKGLGTIKHCPTCGQAVHE